MRPCLSVGIVVCVFMVSFFWFYGVLLLGIVKFSARFMSGCTPGANAAEDGERREKNKADGANCLHGVYRVIYGLVKRSPCRVLPSKRARFVRLCISQSNHQPLIALFPANGRGNSQPSPSYRLRFLPLLGQLLKR